MSSIFMGYLQQQGVFHAAGDDHHHHHHHHHHRYLVDTVDDQNNDSNHLGAAGERANLWTEPAVLALFAWLVVEITLTLGSYHQVLRNAPAWQSHLGQGKETIAYAAMTACVGSFLVVGVGGLLGVSLTTCDLNPNTVVVLRGISLMVASMVFLVISLRVGRRWLGIKYRYTVRGRENDAWEVEFYSFKALRFHVRWSCTMSVVSIFLPLLLFYCGETLTKLYGSVLGGLLVGGTIVGLFWIDTSRWIVSTCWRLIFAILLGCSLSVISSYLFAVGCYYIYVVWGGRNQSEQRYAIVIGAGWIVWLLLCFLVHGGKFGGVKTKLQQDRRTSLAAEAATAAAAEEEEATDKHNKGQYYPEVDILLEPDDDDDDDDNDEMPKKDEYLNSTTSMTMVDNDDSAMHDSSTTTMTTRQRRRLLPSMKVWRSVKLSSMHDSSNNTRGDDDNDDDGMNYCRGIPRRDDDNMDHDDDDDDDEMIDDDEDAMVEQFAMDVSAVSTGIRRRTTPSATVVMTTLLADADDKSRWQLFCEKVGGSCICCGCCKYYCCCVRKKTNHDDDENDEDDRMRMMGTSSPNKRVSFAHDYNNENHDPITKKDDLEDNALPTIPPPPPPPIGQQIWAAVKWTTAIVVNLFCLFCLIVCIGASAQGRITKDHYEPTNIAIYGEGIDNGPVCAMDDVALTDQGDIRTFPNRDAAHLANYTILHCGACAACSTWWDLEQEYCTRNNLAERSQKCAAKAILDLDGSLDCTLNIFPGEACAKCWVDDYKCVHRYCMFLGLQAVLINALLNFEVAEGVITPANCEEANCEGPDYGGGERVPFNGYWGGFVKCSGATRRRMNVQSSIKRPASDMCSIVDVDYEALFGPCG